MPLPLHQFLLLDRLDHLSGGLLGQLLAQQDVAHLAVCPECGADRFTHRQHCAVSRECMEAAACAARTGLSVPTRLKLNAMTSLRHISLERLAEIRSTVVAEATRALCPRSHAPQHAPETGGLP
jgi:hypothetical protein